MVKRHIDPAFEERKIASEREYRTCATAEFWAKMKIEKTATPSIKDLIRLISCLCLKTARKRYRKKDCCGKLQRAKTEVR